MIPTIHCNLYWTFMYNTSETKTRAIWFEPLFGLNYNQLIKIEHFFKRDFRIKFSCKEYIYSRLWQSFVYVVVNLQMHHDLPSSNTKLSMIGKLSFLDNSTIELNSANSKRRKTQISWWMTPSVGVNNCHSTKHN